MFQRLVNHNPDLRRLVDRGYAVAIAASNHLIIRDIPYLDANASLQWGAIVCNLVFTDTEHVQQDDHQVFFAGGPPYQMDRTPIANLAGGPMSIDLAPPNSDVVVQRSFSNKPFVNGVPTAFLDFYSKIESYVAIISGPASDLHGVTPYTFRAVDDDNEDTIFKFQDTLTSRANIGDLASSFEDDVVAIVGLGGTGSYVLDFIAKTRVKEVRGFDGDEFHVHNSYRAPGMTNVTEFRRPKAEVLQQRYANFRNGLDLRAQFLDPQSAEGLDGVTFAFVCVDSGPSRKVIFDILMERGIPFIDVGMGLKKRPNGLSGAIRVTQFFEETGHEVRARGFATEAEEPENLYRANIQIAELNALNAAIAVIKFKQRRGFYRDDVHSQHLIFSIADLTTFAEVVDED